MSEILKNALVIIVGIGIGTWLAMIYCALTKLRITGLRAFCLPVEVMVQFPWLCWRILNQKLRAPIKIGKLEASDLTYIAVFPLDKVAQTSIYQGGMVWEAHGDAEIVDLLGKIKSQTAELPCDCYGIMHLKDGPRVSWILRKGKFTVSHVYDEGVL